MILTYTLHRDDYHVNASVQVRTEDQAIARISEEREKGYDIGRILLDGKALLS